MTILNHFSTFYNAIKNKFAFKDDVYTKNDVYSKSEVYTKEESYAVTKEYINSKHSDKELYLISSTTDSTKKFKITVDDSGTISMVDTSDSSVSYQVATKSYVNNLIGGIENGTY